MATLDEARAAKQEMLEHLASVDELAAVGITEDTKGFGLRVNLRRKGAKIPSKFRGVPVQVEYVGRVRAL
jgi:hypothetical protein